MTSNDREITLKEFLNAKINAQKEFIDAILKERDERLAQKFDSLATAINKAEVATEKRFESVNEFRATLTDQQKTFITISEYKVAHQNLVDSVNTSIANINNNITTQKERIDKIENIKQGSSNMYILIVGVAGILMAIASFIFNVIRMGKL